MRRDRGGGSCCLTVTKALPARAFMHSEVPETKLPRCVAGDNRSFAMVLGSAQVVGREIFVAPATSSDPGKTLASRHQTTREVRLCQSCDFAAQSHPIGHHAVTVSLPKVNSPYQFVNSCKRAGHASGFTEHGHLLSSESLGIMEEETICRS